MDLNIAVVLAILIVLVPLVWGQPLRGVFLLVAAAVTVEIFPLGFPDSLTDHIPFFQNLNNYTAFSLSFSPAEILMVTGLIGWWANAAAAPHSLMRPSGRLLGAYGVFVCIVLLSAVRGALTGGDLNIVLWELRPQVYGFILFVLAASLIRERSHLLWLAGILFIGAGLKALLGFVRYFFTYQRDLSKLDSILAHEESYFLALFLLGLACVLIWYRRRKLVLPLIVIAPFVALVLLENRRRAALIALAIALIVVAVLAIRLDGRERIRVAVISTVFVLGLTAFIAVNWNKQSGIVGQIVRPVHSVFEPDDRDYSSNLYRTNENANLRLTFDSNKLLGVGFGSPMRVVFPLADISQSYPLWQYIPHNTLLWIGMRMGLLGFMAFFGLIGMTILEGVHQAASRSDPLVRAIAVFALAAIVAQLVVAYGDLQLENYRNMIFLGALIGILDALPRIPDASQHESAPATVLERVAPIRTVAFDRA